MMKSIKLVILVIFILFFACENNKNQQVGKVAINDTLVTVINSVMSLEERLKGLNRLEKAQKAKELYDTYKERWDILVSEFKKKKGWKLHFDKYIMGQYEIDLCDVKRYVENTTFVEKYKEVLLSALNHYPKKEPALELGSGFYFDHHDTYPCININDYEGIEKCLAFIKEKQGEITWGENYWILIDSLQNQLKDLGWNFLNYSSLQAEEELVFYKKMVAANRKSPTDLPLELSKFFKITGHHVKIDYKSDLQTIFDYFNSKPGKVKKIFADEKEKELNNLEKAKIKIETENLRIQEKKLAEEKMIKKRTGLYKYYKELGWKCQSAYGITNEEINAFLEKFKPEIIDIKTYLIDNGRAQLQLCYDELSYEFGSYGSKYVEVRIDINNYEKSKQFVNYVVDLMAYGFSRYEITKGLIDALNKKGWNIRADEYYEDHKIKSRIKFLFDLHHSGYVYKSGEVVIYISDEFAVNAGVLSIPSNTSLEKLKEFLEN